MSLGLSSLGCHIHRRVGLARVGLGIQEGGRRDEALQPCLAQRKCCVSCFVMQEVISYRHATGDIPRHPPFSSSSSLGGGFHLQGTCDSVWRHWGCHDKRERLFLASPGRRHEVCSSKYFGAQDSPPVVMNFLVPKANRAIRRSALT